MQRDACLMCGIFRPPKLGLVYPSLYIQERPTMLTQGHQPKSRAGGILTIATLRIDRAKARASGTTAVGRVTVGANGPPAHVQPLYLYWPVKPMLLPWNATVRVSRRPSICLLSNSTTMVRALSLSTHPPATTDVFLCFRASCAGPHPTCPTPLEFLENLKSSHVVVPPRSTTASFDGENLAVDGGLAPVFHVGS